MYQKEKKENATWQVLYINSHTYSEQPGASTAALRCQLELMTPVPNFQCYGVLVSAGTELTLFLVAGTVLWFGFSVRIMLIAR